VRKKENGWVFGGVLPEKEENERRFWVAGDWPESGGRVVISAFFYFCGTRKLLLTRAEYVHITRFAK